MTWTNGKRIIPIAKKENFTIAIDVFGGLSAFFNVAQTCGALGRNQEEGRRTKS